MLNGRINEVLQDVFEETGLSPLPMSIIDRDGRPMDLSQDKWHFNVESVVLSFDWTDWGLTHPVLAYAAKRYVLRFLQINSPMEAYNVAKEFRLLLSGLAYKPEDKNERNCIAEQWQAIQKITDLERLAEKLFGLLGMIMNHLREHKALYRFTRIRSWYGWATDALPDLCFLEEYALEIGQVSIPGNEKGEAVKTEDEGGGPLFEIEVAALRNALKQDSSTNRNHIMQRTAVALCLKYGRNARNFALLREEDFYDALADLPKEIDGFLIEPEWRLNIPRIKKRGIGARQDFIEENVDKLTARHIQELIRANQRIDTHGRPRPLFMLEEPLKERINGPLKEYAYHIQAAEIRDLLQAFAERMKLISPRTGARMHLTPRRLRYTFATMMVELGASKEALARMLDHSSTKHVGVYYDLKGKRLTRILDQAAAKKFSSFIPLFKGRVVDSDAEAVNGDNPAKHLNFVDETNPNNRVDIGVCGQKPLCGLDPPYSCYLCPQFQPYRQADHQAVLATMLADREARMEKYGTRLGVQLDDVIIAVTNVIDVIEQEAAARGQPAE